MSSHLNLSALRREMIGEFLRSRGLNYTQLENGAYYVSFRWASRFVDVIITPDATGAVLGFKARDRSKYPVDRVPLLLLVLNQYMRGARWPRLTVAVQDGDAYVEADGHHFLFDAQEQAEVDRFLESEMASLQEFWQEFSVPEAAVLDEEMTAFLRDLEEGAA